MSEEQAAPAPGPSCQGDAVAELEGRLGLRLADRETALAALTHKSYVNEHREVARLVDNERLEFLGDAVIDLAVSHRLMERFPGAREGELSKMRAAVVDEPGLCAMARALDLGQLLRLGRGEELTGGRQKASLLADAMEAVVAAVFLEAGLGPVLGIVDRFLGEAFARASAGTLDRDFKTQLQELAQSRFRSTPRYKVVAEQGPDHSKTFEVETDLRGEVLGRGTGRSKKDAEQAAAKIALEALARRPAGAGAPGEGLPGAETAPGPEAPASPLPPEAIAAPPPSADGATPEPAPSPPPARKARTARTRRKATPKPARRKAPRPRRQGGARGRGGRPAARARPRARRGSGP
ncbi:MAG TPA: ribonuclease III [Anaeromyxobacter sp.]|nr:ribonuclease III [Anaeromyxobacter sp.]